ncbi:protein kinase domain-containing protein [Mycobacterium bourgelatii]|uniref:non-specific serine/threonine protein kinase n=1 Tax=Mycobacterium bourgelatii TaxID=1273442 RepID=A0A7I9YQK5_MYCBU|nr:serine/threonine-protein kinase [Mycobacterium bourgelatii]GFG90918.1 hypothetical protein MBOU_29600 [Mycobacterium bourgelatii]
MQQTHGQLYVDMRLIEGNDLNSVLVNGPMPVDKAVRIVEQVAKALQAAHKAGLVHRDVKPSNILLDEDDDAYLIDFGLALGTEQTSLTQAGMMIGSWHYMAPERFRGTDVDARADIYALACVLYECLTGIRPFAGDTLESQMAAHLTDSPPQPTVTRPDVPAGFDPVIAKGMAKNPDDRYPSVAEFAAAARAAIESPSSPGALHSAPTTISRSSKDIATSARWKRPSKRVIVRASGAVAIVIAICLAFFLGQSLSGQSGKAIERNRSNPTSSAQSNPSKVPTASTSDSPPGSAGIAADTAHDVEVVGFVQVGDSLNVRLKNPNPDVGLVRSPFELAMIEQGGAVLATEGQGGLPGAAVNTIYQLPPGGEYGLEARVPSGKTVASVQLTVLGRWLRWDTVNPPTVTLTDAAVGADTGFGGPSVTGRLTLDKDGPLNVVVKAFVRTSAGTVVSDVFVDCVKTGQQRTFQARSFAEARGPYELDKIVAYATSVKGAGPQYTPQC